MQVPLTFNPVAGDVESKAAVHTAMTGRYDERESFAVYAAYAVNSFDVSDNTSYTNFWNNTSETCGYQSAYHAWAPSGNTYYWPMVGTLTFQAYSPADLGGNAATPSFTWAGGFTFTGFQIPAVGAQYDLMYSDRVENCRRSDYTTNAQGYDDDNDQTGGHVYNGIDLAFKHALSLVEVQAVSSLGTNSAVKFRVKNVCVINAYDTGTYTQAGESWTLNTGHTATYNILGQDIWKEPLPGANDYETEFPIAPALILMPQPLDHDGVNGFSQSSDVYISLTYEKYEGSTVLKTETITWPLPTSYTEEGPGGTTIVTTGWLPSRKYTYRFVFSDHIEFEASISPWKETPRGHYLIVQ
jgi:hypothetical protein